MSANSNNPPERGGRGAVTSLVDRLPTARRTMITMRDHVSDERYLEYLGAMAERLVDIDFDARLDLLDRMREDREVFETRLNLFATRAAQRFLRNDRDGAFEEWAALIAEYPDDAIDAYRLRSMFRMVIGDLEGALADASRAIEIAPTYAEWYCRRGDIYTRMGREAEAIANYRRCAQLDKGHLYAHTELAASLLIVGDYGEALEWYTRAIRLAPKRASLYVGRALCYEHMDRLDEARADLDTAIELDPESPDAHHTRGRCRPASERREAIADFTRAIDLDPDDGEVWGLRARERLLSGDHAGALADATRAVEIEPDIPGAHFTRGAALHAERRMAEAIEAYDRASALDPTEMLYVVLRARAHKEIGDFQALRKDLDVIVRLDPTDARIRAMHGDLLVYEGAHTAALEHLDAALALVESDPEAVFDAGEIAEIHRNRALALRALGQLDEARAAEALGAAPG